MGKSCGETVEKPGAVEWRGDPRVQRFWVGRAVEHCEKTREELVMPTGGTDDAPTWDRAAVQRAIDAAAGPALDVCRALLERMRRNP